MSDKFSCRSVDKNLVDQFEEIVTKKHGKSRNGRKTELEKALKLYLDYEKTGKKQGNNTEKKTKAEIRYNQVLEMLNEEYPEGGSEKQEILRDKIGIAIKTDRTDTISASFRRQVLEGNLEKSDNGMVLIFPDRIDNYDKVKNHMGELDLPEEMQRNILNGSATHFAHPKRLVKIGQTITIGKLRYEIVDIQTVSKRKIWLNWYEELGCADDKEVVPLLYKCYTRKVAEPVKKWYVHEVKAEAESNLEEFNTLMNAKHI